MGVWGGGEDGAGFWSDGGCGLWGRIGFGELGAGFGVEGLRGSKSGGAWFGCVGFGWWGWRTGGGDTHKHKHSDSQAHTQTHTQTHTHTPKTNYNDRKQLVVTWFPQNINR